MNSTFRACWLASSEVISQVLFTSEQQTKSKMAFVGILSPIKLLFWPLVIQLVWYILKQLFTEVEVNSGGYLPRRSSLVNIHNYSPPLRWIIVKYNSNEKNISTQNMFKIYWRISLCYWVIPDSLPQTAFTIYILNPLAFRTVKLLYPISQSKCPRPHPTPTPSEFQGDTFEYRSRAEKTKLQNYTKASECCWHLRSLWVCWKHPVLFLGMCNIKDNCWKLDWVDHATFFKLKIMVC